MQFRDVPPEDFAELTDLWVESWKTLGWDIDFDERRDWLPGYLGELIADGARVIGVYDTQLRGFFTLNLRSQYMDQICVSPAAFGKGLSRALLNEAKRMSPEGIDLVVNAANARAIQCYLRENFSVSGEGISARSGMKTLKMRWQP